jgi:Straboviridae SbcC-like subunit of palindrome specific endonuclease
MNIEFEKIRFKNVNTFGNAWTEFYFKPGLNLVTGTNGSGKSTFLLDVLSFANYGKPYRSIKIDELINNKNCKQLVAESYFKIDDDKYSIQRGLKPSFIKLLKNGEEVELLSHKSLIQEEIDKLLGINHNLFKQIISLSLLNNKPFLSLDAKEKREITESVFNIKVFGRMLKSLKKNNSITKNSIDLNEKEISMSKENLEGLVSQIKSLTKLKDEFDVNKKMDLDLLNSKCTILNDELRVIHRSLATLYFKEIIFDSTVKKALKEKRDNNTKKFMTFNNQLQSKNEELKFLEDESNDFDDFERKYNELRELVSSCYEFMKDLQNQHAKKVKEVENIHKKKQLDNQLELQTVESQINEYNKEKSFLTKDYIEKNLTEVIEKNKILSENKIKIANYKADIELLKSKEGYCSHCKQDVSEEHKQKEIESRKESIKSISVNNDILIAEMEAIISNHIREKNDIITAEMEVRREKIHDLNRTNLLNESKVRDEILLLELGLKQEIKTLNDRKEEVITKYVNSLKESLSKEIEDLEKQSKDNFNESKKLDSELNVLEKKEIEFLKKKSDFEKLKLQEKNLVDNMTSLASSMEEIEYKVFTADISTLKNDFETRKTNYQELKSKCELQKRKLKIEEVIKSVLDEEGIKKYFFSRLIPKLNQIINEYLNHFELPIYFNFDEMFEYEIKEVGNNSRTYQSFSGGERFRIDLSIILSFIELNKLINNFNCNIQIFDELLDSGIDADGMEGVLEKLKELTDKNNICTYIISHRPIESSEYIDNIVKIEKKSGFSRIIT